MSLPPDPSSASPTGTAAAWLGGCLAAAAGAGLTFFPDAFSSAGKVWPALGLAPASFVPAMSSFWIALTLGVGAVWLGIAISPARRVLLLLGAAAFLTFSQSAVLALHGWHWEPLPALLTMLAGGGTALLLRPAANGPAVLFLGRLSAASLANLEKARDVSFLRPDQREATVLTCRLLNENALREVLPARDFLKLCETFRAQASALLLQHGACLDPAEPNGVRAFFGLPLPTPTPADEAVRAALALDDAVRGWFTGLTSAAAEVPVCGIGLATGTLTAGVTGSAYTVLGDAVELSRWLALQNSSYQTRLLLDAATHLAADAVEDRPLEFINPPDGAAVEIFQLLGTGGSLSREGLARRNAFRDAIMLLRAGHAEDAARRFDAARPDPATTDPVLEYFVSMALDQAQRDAASHGQTTPGAALPNSAAASPAPIPRRPGKTGRKLPRRP